MQPALNGIDRDAELVGRFRGGQFVKIAQDQYLAVRLRERRDGGNQVLAQSQRQRLLTQHSVQ